MIIVHSINYIESAFYEDNPLPDKFIISSLNKKLEFLEGTTNDKPLLSYTSYQTRRIQLKSWSNENDLLEHTMV